VALRLRVDTEICIGSGTCELLVPDVFKAGEEGFVIVVGAAGKLTEAEVSRLVAECPSGALQLDERA
jgi:ferredoxin